MQTKIYRNPFKVIPAAIVIICVTAPMIPIAISATQQIINTPNPSIEGIVITACLWALAFFVMQSWLSIIEQCNQFVRFDEEGLTCYGPRYRLYAPWNNVVGIRTYQGPNGRISRSLILKEPPMQSMSLEEGKMQSLAVVAKRRFQPIQTYGVSYPLVMVPKSAWKDGELTSVLQAFLSSAEGHPTSIEFERPTQQEKQPKATSKGIWLLFFAMMLYFIGITILSVRHLISPSSSVAGLLVVGIIFYIFSCIRVATATKYNPAVFALGQINASIIGMGLEIGSHVFLPLTSPLTGAEPVVFLVTSVVLNFCLAMVSRRRLKKVQRQNRCKE